MSVIDQWQIYERAIVLATHLVQETVQYDLMIRFRMRECRYSITYIAFSMEDVKRSTERIGRVVKEFCPVMDCASVIAKYEVQARMDYLEMGLMLQQSSLKVLKRFAVAHRSKKKRRKFWNSVRMHCYWISQFIRRQYSDLSMFWMHDHVVSDCRRMSERFNFGRDLFV